MADDLKKSIANASAPATPVCAASVSKREAWVCLEHAVFMNESAFP